MTLKDYIILDLETTGLSKYSSNITEIAAIKVEDGEIKDVFQTLVNPEMHIPSNITRLTGITDSMVSESPTIKEALPDFINFMEDKIMVAHNATFDHGFIEYHAAKHLNHQVTNQKLCTKKLANRLVPQLPSKKLSSLCSHFEVTNEQAHRAMADVKATYQVFQKFLDMMEEKGFVGQDKIMDFEQKSIPRSYRRY